MVALSTVKTEDGKVSCETPEGTVINININQRSCIDSLVDAVKNARMVKKDGKDNQPGQDNQPGRDNQPTKETPSGLYLGVGVSFMSLGFISVMLAIIIEVVHPDLTILYTGTHFWVGFPFLVSGVLNVVTYKCPKAFWVFSAFISLLVCLAVSIAGLVFVANDTTGVWWRNNRENLCDNLRQRQNGYYYQTTPPSWYNRYDGNRDYYLEECKRGFQQYQKLLFGLVIMSLLMLIWGLCVSAITLLYRVKVFFSACNCEKVEEEKDDPLLSAIPANDVIIA